MNNVLVYVDNPKWWKFYQNNSGGTPEYTDNVGDIVYIQAHSALIANAIAESIGIYFDGCERKVDCACCGDRWDMAYEGIEEFPKYHGKRDYAIFEEKPADKNYFVFHYLNGKIEYGIPMMEDKETVYDLIK